MNEARFFTRNFTPENIEKPARTNKAGLPESLGAGEKLARTNKAGLPEPIGAGEKRLNFCRQLRSLQLIIS